MRRAILVVCDSLRADMIQPDVAPALAALGEGAARYVRARSVFPSVTRVTSASIATGCHPGRHGLLGNTMVIDEGQGLVCLSVVAPREPRRLSVPRRAASASPRTPVGPGDSGNRSGT